MNQNKEILRAFLNHFDEFILDINKVIPNETLIKKVEMYFNTMKKINPKRLLMAWKTCIVEPYRKEIDEGNINFFLTKNYKEDLTWVDKKHDVEGAVNFMFSKISIMHIEDHQKAMKYVQNLTKISDLYK